MRSIRVSLSPAVLSGLMLTLGAGTVARGQLVVAGSLEYDSTSGSGYRRGVLAPPFITVPHDFRPSRPRGGVNNSGVAVSYAVRYIDAEYGGERAMRWDASGAAATELGHLGFDGREAEASAYAVNDAGTAVGFARKYDEELVLNVGTRAVRWDAGTTEAVELGNLGTIGDHYPYTRAEARDVNAAGTAVGWALKYVDGDDRYQRAVRWDAGGTEATELGHLGLDSRDRTQAEAYAVNEAGTAVGWAEKYEDGSDLGTRAVRWDAGGTEATELGHLGLHSWGSTEARAYAVNAEGTAVGFARKHIDGDPVGPRAVRWEAGGTEATELGHLGLWEGVYTTSIAYAVNAAGTAVGWAEKIEPGDVWSGSRAVRWDAGGTEATELGHLGLHDGYYTDAEAYAVNDAGTAVGWAEKIEPGNVWLGTRAVVWLPDASAIDLNDLGVVPNPAGGTWILSLAGALSADGWVAGTGTFTPDVGDPYVRHWVGQIGLGGTWLNTSGENHAWGRGPNWSTGTPAIQLDAVFDAPATYTVDFDRNERARDIVVADGDVTFALGAFDLTVASTLTIQSGARLSSDGTLIGLVENHGVLSPGTSPGPLTIVGDLINPGVLEFEIASTSLFDSLEVTGLLDLDGGTVAIVLLDGFMPSGGDVFPLASFGSLTGTFGFDFSQAALDPGLGWGTSRFASEGLLEVTQVIPEPGSATLLALAVGAAWFRRRRNGRRQPGSRRFRS